MESWPDPVFAEIAKDLGNPPFIFLDLRPVTYPMVVVTSHEVAEQISRVSKLFPWSTPKSPTMGALVQLIGPESILLRKVGKCLGGCVPTSPAVTDGYCRTRTGSSCASDSTPGLRRSI
jgi:hypothetical protein